MKETAITAFAICLAAFLCLPAGASAQTINILGGNTLNGAVQGTALGGATMALRNSNDFAPLRVGAGAGTLYGISVGVYDITQAEKGQNYYVSGIFNDGDNSTVIVLLDTIYGAAAGAIIATSFNLIANEPVRDGLQYGSGIGAWAGFGFGLIDSFILSKRATGAGTPDALPENEENGLISYSDRGNNVQIGMVNPAVYSYARFEPSDITLRRAFAVDILNVRLDF